MTVVDDVLSNREMNQQWHAIAILSKTIDPKEQRYDIQNDGMEHVREKKSHMQQYLYGTVQHTKPKHSKSTNSAKVSLSNTALDTSLHAEMSRIHEPITTHIQEIESNQAQAASIGARH